MMGNKKEDCMNIWVKRKDVKRLRVLASSKYEPNFVVFERMLNEAGC